MKNELNISTRKIEVRFYNKENNDIEFKRLKELSTLVDSAYNIIINNQFFNVLLKERISHLSDIDINKKKIDEEFKLKELLLKKKECKDDKEIEKINKDISKINKNINSYNNDLVKIIEKNIFGESIQNTTYGILADDEKYNKIPSGIRAALNSQLYKNFNNEINDILKGKKTIRNYRKGQPILFNNMINKFEIDINNNYFFNWNNFKFILHFGKDESGNKIVIDKIMKGEYTYGDSSIQIKKNKIFLNLVVKMPKEKKELNENKILGIDMGMVNPLSYAIKNTKIYGHIGNGEKLRNDRIIIQKRREILQKSLTDNSLGGHGRKRKNKAFYRLSNYERNFVHTKNHEYSKKIIDIALNNQCGIIHLEFLEGFGKDTKNNWVLRNWSYFELQTMIEQKAKKYNIIVKYIDPYHTSQKCHICGKLGNRETQSDFICINSKCENYNEKINADTNAAFNIANTDIFPKNKYDTLFYKNKKEKSIAI